ncbi:hypothetical protein ONZ51_g11523 [Trametes cubensis]|uniref:DNA helicase n=1 Tax=Trametes cubensis TaxID=1111947 RepID=A0AAD7TJ39_9APHY|nr:hypothetical protein ONZ51_g11523 [Trametes cubensis]
MRCNMDIKFIGTGEDAKAVLYYITDYITKSQLKTHVAYAALALGVERAQDKSTVTSDWTANTKRMLQKCAFSLVANQELSAQQVAQYLQGFDDHFTSHKYANLYWPSFERHIEFLCPSPECEYSTAVELPDDNATGDVEHMPSSDLDFSPDSENIVVDDVQLIDDEAEDDEVVISTDDTGHLVPLSSQLRDYIYRGPALNDINLWNFVGKTEKICKRAAQVDGLSSADPSDEDYDTYEMDENMSDAQLELTTETDAELDSTEMCLPMANSRVDFLEDHNEEQRELHNDQDMLPAISDPIYPAQLHSVNIESHILKWELNAEQAQVFRMIAKHTLELQPAPLRMYLGGYGGTGIAARNVDGVTLHAALALDSRKGNNPIGNQTRNDLMRMWEGVDYLLIDEISMVGYTFGGISVIVAGDFAQLPPVGETRLYSWVDTKSNKRAKPSAQQIVAGKLLWLSFTSVVILHQIMRDDFDLLQSRVLENNPSLLDDKCWANAPIVVYDNATKDALNQRAAEEFARKSGRPLMWYYALDKHSGKAITDEQLRLHLTSLPSGETQQRLGRIPLVIGMPVIVSQNFDVESGIVNGSRGDDERNLARYKTRADGKNTEDEDASNQGELWNLAFSYGPIAQRSLAKRTHDATIPGALTIKRNDANVSWNALMIHVDSASDMSNAVTRDGIAEKSAVLLNTSRNRARQKLMSSAYRRTG